MFLKIICCILIADFITGIVHWWEDTYGNPTWPIIGKEVIVPNIEHHKFPGKMGYMTSFIFRNYQAIILALVSIAIFYYLGISSWYLILIGITAAIGNETHLWCHRNTNNKFINLLQDMCLVITPQDRDWETY